MTGAFLTVISQNYAPQAKCLAESLRKHHPKSRLTICLLEEAVNADIFGNGDADIILAKDVVGPGFYDLAYKYDLTELATAIKPFAIKRLFERGEQEVIYVDPDCYIYSPLEEVFDLLRQGASIVLTPHATDPISDGLQPGEIDFLRTGTFNLGFIGIRQSPETSRFLEWWSERLRDHCAFDPVAGLFVDQKWVDLAPSFFDRVEILRHPGYNVAYWNIFQRPISRAQGQWLARGEPLRFFHFSGLPKEDVKEVSCHQNRLSKEDIGPFFVEFETYLARLASNGLKPDEERHYSYALHWRGQCVDSASLRSSLRKSVRPQIESLADLQDEGRIATLLEPHPDLPADEMFPISKLLYEAWLDRPALARQFPLFTAEGRAKFLFWVLDCGHRQLQVDRALLPWRELTTPVPEALGGLLPIPPLVWLAWLTDAELRRSTQFDGESGFGHILIELRRQIEAGERPDWLLPDEYLSSVVIGEEGSAITVAQYAVWQTRPDLQHVFDLQSVQGRTAFRDWCYGESPRVEMPWMVKFVQPDAARSVAA